MTIRLIPFSRVSIAPKGQDPCSLDLQNQAIEAYVNAFPDLVLIEPPKGIVETGYVDADREQFHAVINRILAGEADGLIVYRLDRFARSVKHGCDVFETLQKHGKQLVSVQDRIDTTSPMGKFVFQVMMGVAELERNTFMDRSSKGRRHKRALRTPDAPYGYWVGGNYPYGYKPGEKTAQGVLLVPDDQEQRVLTLIDDWRLRGYMLSDIAAFLNSRGLLTRTGKPWTMKSLSKILLKQRNLVATGIAN